MSTVLREPLSRARSLASYNNVPKEMFGEFVETYVGQPRYILYNSCEARDDISMPPACWCRFSPTGVTGHLLSDNEIDEVLAYLSEFDIVKKMEELDDFVAKSEALTGWTSSAGDRQVPKKNKPLTAYEWTPEMYDMLAPSLKEDQAVWDCQFA
jgi:hypothetical protein